jgi:5-methyltetrahydrofolate--homocysteine methyltransferase
MASILSALAERKLLVSDGGWGTFLVAAGLGAGECPELWNIDHPDVVRNIAATYAEAGADIVMTNSFGGSRITLEPHGLAGRAAELNEAAARLSREAVGDGIIVLASVGPTGKILMMGDVTESEVYDAFAEQVTALERGGADACSVETMTAVDEAAIAARAVKENTSMQLVCSFTFTMRTDTGYRTMMGVSAAEMAQAMLAVGADVLGVNCSLGPAEMIEVVRDLRAAAPDTPILVHPNAGMPRRADDGAITYPETPEGMAARVPDLVSAGASIVGGCCGTGPDHIRAIARVVRKLRAT